MEAKLVPAGGGEAISLTRDITVVGRGSSLCDLVLKVGNVSKLQCLIAKTDGLLFIRDLGSTNGTKVNGQRVTRGALLPGDELAFAGVKFRVHFGPSPPGAEEGISPEEETALFAGSGESSRRADSSAGVGNSSESDVRFLSDDSIDD